MGELARWLDVPLRFFDAATLEAETPRLANPSDVVFAEVGAHGVSEAAALAAAGPDATLLVPKHKSQRATCAVALAPAPFDGALAGVMRSEEHTSELQSLMRISYAVFCLKKKRAEVIKVVIT